MYISVGGTYIDDEGGSMLEAGFVVMFGGGPGGGPERGLTLRFMFIPGLLLVPELKMEGTNGNARK